MTACLKKRRCGCRKRPRKTAACAGKRVCKKNAAGKQPVRRCYTKFIERQRMNVPTHNDWTPSLLVNSSLLSLYTYAVVNRGDHPCEVKVEVSPNGTDFASDAQTVVKPGATQTVVPLRFLKYTRFSIKSQQADKPTMLDLYFQAQTAV